LEEASGSDHISCTTTTIQSLTTLWRTLLHLELFHFLLYPIIPWRGFDSRPGLGSFLFATASRPGLGRTQPPIKRVPGAISPRVKRPGR